MDTLAAPQDRPMKGRIIADVCQKLTEGATDIATSLLKREYPFAPKPLTKRQYGAVESTLVFVRDSFIDRYTGEPLVFPPVLRVLSAVLPADFPFHPNWKTDVTHPAYWEVGATVDHLIPVSLGGSDDEPNWFTTSMARNSAKMNWTLAELGWTLHPPGDLRTWDGLMRWFLDYTAAHPNVLTNPSVRQWHNALLRALALMKGDDEAVYGVELGCQPYPSRRPLTRAPAATLEECLAGWITEELRYKSVKRALLRLKRGN